MAPCIEGKEVRMYSMDATKEECMDATKEECMDATKEECMDATKEFKKPQHVFIPRKPPNAWHSMEFHRGTGSVPRSKSILN
jgi:hypothetical protein